MYNVCCFFGSLLIHVLVSILVAKKDDQQLTKTAPQCSFARSEAEHELTALAFIRLLGAVHLVPGNAGVDRMMVLRLEGWWH